MVTKYKVEGLKMALIDLSKMKVWRRVGTW